MLLLPVAMFAWAGTITSPRARRAIWVATALFTVGAGISKSAAPKRPERSASAPLIDTTIVAQSTAGPSTVPTSKTTIAARTTTSRRIAALPSSTTLVTTIGSKAAADVLDTLAVAPEHPDGYSRELFPTWLAVDPGGCDARVLVLRRESTQPIANGSARCSAAGGAWTSAYDGTLITDPGDAEIDHVVSLKEAWDSGAWAWTIEERAAYANDITDSRTLHAGTPAANRDKSDKDPSNWLPRRAEYVCTYLSEWVAIKARWRLAIDESEAGRIRTLFQSTCRGLIVAAWTLSPTRLPSATSAPPTTGVAPTTTATIQGLLTPPANTPPPARPSPPSSPAEPAPPANEGEVVPGAYCGDAGATGTAGGKSYVCDRFSRTGSSYKDGRFHWRPI